MTNFDELNRSVNRALRELNKIAVCVASSSIERRNEATRAITQALAHLDSLQQCIISSAPDLEFHYDPNREPSRLMRVITDLAEVAESHVQQGNTKAATEAFLQLMDMEPPPLIYEMIEKRLASLGATGNR
jgi:hypothetical protein